MRVWRGWRGNPALRALTEVSLDEPQCFLVTYARQLSSWPTSTNNSEWPSLP